jgi:glutamine synthetase
MTANPTRLGAIREIEANEAPAAFFNGTGDSPEIFGENVFSLPVMAKRLPKSVYKSVAATIEKGDKLDPAIADVVAAAMKDWAMEKGVTHYAHVFYPLTGLTAEKHDSFMEPVGDGTAIWEFQGKILVQGEPDASSFPNGGIRATFEARGYTGWDVQSPAYILENPNGSTLCIPTIFVSMTGEALDYKTPLLRSQKAMSEQATRVLAAFGHKDIDNVVSYCGPEQEYFLVDTSFVNSRPDLLIAGRTLFGAKPAKGQEFDDHYFGAIPERVLAFMHDTERALFKLGVPAKTRHNEVAPGQFEIAPVFQKANLAADHQQLLMTTFKSIAKTHGFTALFHEKPFAGVNGSGKHVNFSFGNGNQGNFLNPGDNPHDNAQFLVFCAAVIRAVHLYGGLLRVSIASAGNDHRLGANEAPPAIISIFLGDQLQDVFEQIAKGGATSSKQKGALSVGVDSLPVLTQDAGDRNRTSPMAFTGNRFEFRAVGSAQTVAAPLVIINTIMAEALDYIATELETSVAAGTDFNDAVQAVLAKVIEQHGAAVFNGNGYSTEWHEEAVSRGLKKLDTTVDSLPEYQTPEAKELFSKYGVFNEAELEARYEVALEQYLMAVNVEANLTEEIAKTTILPSAVRYQTELADNIASLEAAGVEADKSDLVALSELVTSLRSGIKSLQAAVAGQHDTEGIDEAAYAKDTVLPAMLAVREAADALEAVVADDLWDLPTYQEMLFIR